MADYKKGGGDKSEKRGNNVVGHGDTRTEHKMAKAHKSEEKSTSLDYKSKPAPLAY